MVQKEQFYFAYRYDDGLYTSLRQNGQTSWVEVEPWPSFVGSDMLFEVGALCYDIIHTNVQTKQMVWETSGHNYLSNLALTGSRVYALREDLTLMAFDLDNGATIGTLRFSGPPAETICSESGSDVYWIVTDGPYVVVYFSDSRELIVFEEKTPS